MLYKILENNYKAQLCYTTYKNRIYGYAVKQQSFGKSKINNQYKRKIAEDWVAVASVMDIQFRLFKFSFEYPLIYLWPSLA